MEIHKGSGLKLIPKEVPPNQPLLGKETELALNEMSEVERLINLWVYYLADQLQIRIPYTATRFDAVAYGFLDPECEVDSFGAILYTRRGDEISTLSNPNPAEIIDFIVADHYRFPIVVRQYNFVLAAPNIHPQNGRSTCWATMRSGGVGGMLTAGHVTDLHQNQKAIPLIDPSGSVVYGQCTKRASAGIDAAFVEPPLGVPTQRNSVQIQNYPTPWSDVNLLTSRRLINTKITSVSDTRGIYVSPSLPARIFLADHGNPGDSGAICTEKDSGKMVGIYMGQLKTMAGADEGFCQHLGQAMNDLDVDVWD